MHSAEQIASYLGRVTIAFEHISSVAALSRETGNWLPLSYQVARREIPGANSFACKFDPDRSKGARWYVALANSQIVSKEETALIQAQAYEEGKKVFSARMTKNVAPTLEVLRTIAEDCRKKTEWLPLALSQLPPSVNQTLFIRRFGCQYYNGLIAAKIVSDAEVHLIEKAARGHAAELRSEARLTAGARKRLQYIEGELRPHVERCRETGNWRALRPDQCPHPLQRSFIRHSGDDNWYEALIKTQLITREERQLIVSQPRIRHREQHPKILLVEIVRRTSSSLPHDFSELLPKIVEPGASLVVKEVGPRSDRLRFVTQVQFPRNKTRTELESAVFRMGSSQPDKWDVLAPTYREYLSQTINYLAVRLLNRYLLDLADKGKITWPATVVSLGSGVGVLYQSRCDEPQLFHHVGSSVVIDVEPSSEMRRLSPNPRTLAGTAEQIPLDNRSMDAIECSILPILSSPLQALTEMSRVLKKEGLLLLRLNGYYFSEELEKLLIQSRFELISPLNLELGFESKSLEKLTDSERDKIRLACSRSRYLVARKTTEDVTFADTSAELFVQRASFGEEVEALLYFRQLIARRTNHDPTLVNRIEQFCEWLDSSSDEIIRRNAHVCTALISRAMRRMFLDSEVRSCVEANGQRLQRVRAVINDNQIVLAEGKAAIAEDTNVGKYLIRLSSAYARVLACCE